MENKIRVCKSILTLNFKNLKGQKLRRNIKIHRDLIFFIFHFPKTREVFIFMIWGLMEIAGNPWKPSMLFRGCPQKLFFAKKRPTSPGHLSGFLGPRELPKNFDKNSVHTKDPEEFQKNIYWLEDRAYWNPTTTTKTTTFWIFLLNTFR